MSDNDDFDKDAYDYEDGEYDDAADDWEAEAVEEEEKAKTEEAARQARKEKKLVTRAPVKKEAEDEEEAVPEDVERAITDMRQVANDIASGSALLGGGSGDLIGNSPVSTEAEINSAAALIAGRLTSLSDTANYDKLVADVFERLAGQMTNSALLTEEADRVHRLREELKRAAKTKPKVVQAAPIQRAGLDLDNFEDRGGAHVTEENEDETGW